MRKKIYAILLATALAGSLASGCMTAFASETEAAVSATEAEEALQANETEAETEDSDIYFERTDIIRRRISERYMDVEESLMSQLIEELYTEYFE